jgi:hypothetical protein
LGGLVERIEQEVNLAALPHPFGKFVKNAARAGMIVTDDELHSV